MRIFLIIPTLRQGGAERVMSEFANEFSNQNYEVHLVLLGNAEDFYKITTSVTIHRLGFVNRGRLRKLIDEIKIFCKLRTLLSDYRPDAVLSFMTKYNIFTILAGSFLNLRIFISDRSNPLKKIPFYLSILQILTYRNATGIIAQTQLAQNVLKKRTGHRNIKVIPNPIKQVELFPEIKREKIILNVGRMVPEKGQKYLLEAFSKLKEKDWELVILGDGPLRNELEEQAKLLGITKNLHMPGTINNIDEWLAKSSIFAFPSVSEGFPNALAEAMSAGLSCVSFNCEAGVKDIIQHGKNGFLVNVRDIDALSVILKKMMDDKVLRDEIGLSASTIKRNLSLDRISREYLFFIVNPDGENCPANHK